MSIGIGQCVGARNHKVCSVNMYVWHAFLIDVSGAQFFLNFNMWAALYCIWIFTTLLPAVVNEGTSPNGNIDIQKVVIVVL